MDQHKERAAVEFRSVTKRFGSFVANSEISFEVRVGSLHGVIGENGAGKSTAMKLLYGMLRPDSGEIRVQGQAVHLRSPKDALAKKIGMVHQHFMLSGPETALENIVLGAEPGIFAQVPLLSSIFPIDWAGARTKLEALANQYGLDVPWDSPVTDLPVGVQQRIEILKLLYRDAEILILDEPTAVLTPQETDALFAQLRLLCEAGKTILVITHKLREILKYTDRVTVFRRGQVVASHLTAGSTPESLAEEMVGRSVILGVSRPAARAPGKELLCLKQVTYRDPSREKPALQQLSLSVRAGEVVGIAGIEGNGQSDLLKVLIDPSVLKSQSNDSFEGEVELLGMSAESWSSEEVRKSAIAFVPEDRHRQALLLDESLKQNFLLGLQNQDRYSKWGVIQSRTLETDSEKALEEWDVRPRNIHATARSLSGGNQQKWVLARELSRQPKLIVVAQPTRGVDVGAIETIHSVILNRRDEGAGVLLISSELDEVLTLSDRVVVLYEGQIVGEFTRQELDERRIGLLMTGGKP